jgi:hypothetical protein
MVLNRTADPETGAPNNGMPGDADVAPAAGEAASTGNGRLVPPTLPTPMVVTAASCDIPPLSPDDETALAEFQNRQQVLRDLVLGCIAGNHTGVYIYGPPGVSKTYTVHATLRERNANWRQHQRITAKPLYLEMENRPGAVHVIDDCEQLFAEKSAQTLLRSALDSQRVSGRRERLVSYSVTGARARVLEHYFHGSLVFLMNRPLTDERPEIRAMLSRIPSLSFAPPDNEIRAVMRYAARQGHVGESGSISAAECVEIVEVVIGLATERQCRLDLRWLEHGYGHYLTQETGGGKVDWRDMLKFHVMRTQTYFDHAVAGSSQSSGRQAKKATPAEQIAIALELMALPVPATERVQLWIARTGLSRATYFRRRDEGLADADAR